MSRHRWPLASIPVVYMLLVKIIPGLYFSIDRSRITDMIFHCFDDGRSKQLTMSDANL